jgi:aspartate aminotransferase
MVARKMLELGRNNSVIRDIAEYGRQRCQEIGPENVYDFSIGNPNVPAPQIVTDTLQALIQQTPAESLHAYTAAPGDFSVRQAVAQYVQNTFGYDAKAEYVYMTAGASSSLTISLNAIAEPGDEVIVFTPYFPEYRVFIEKTGAKFVAVNSAEKTFQIDVEALTAAINAHTKAVIVNSPSNPTGVVLNRESIEALADILTKKSEEYGHPIYLIADEPYRELVYGDTEVPYIPLFYRNTIVCYSFSKSLSLPGERIGYILVSTDADDADAVFDAVCGAGRALGYICAPSLLQQLIKTCLGQTADISVYDENRTLLYNALTEYGYEAVYPDGAFYLFVRSPEPDANAFCEKARAYDLLLVPADSFGCPGYVRIAYCVTTDQIRRSLPAFGKLAAMYRGE